MLVEKPLALNTAECDAMIAACRTAGVTLSVIQTVRFRGTVARGKRMIDQGRIGPVRMIRLSTLFPWVPITSKDWTKLEAEGGLILDQGAHNFDFMRWFAGAEAKRLFARIAQFQEGPHPSPTAMAQVEFTNGPDRGITPLEGILASAGAGNPAAIDPAFWNPLTSAPL